MIFVASPYSSPDPLVQAIRYHAVLDFVTQRLREGEHVVSPIVHCHTLAHKHDMPKDAGYWKRYSETLIGVSSYVYVYCYNGWQESKGVAYEIKYARNLRIPIFYWNADGKCIGEVIPDGQDY